MTPSSCLQAPQARGTSNAAAAAHSTDVLINPIHYYSNVICSWQEDIRGAHKCLSLTICGSNDVLIAQIYK